PTAAVMMATPADLEDSAVGFRLTDGVITHPAQLRDLEVVRRDEGVEVRGWLAPEQGARLARRRRWLAGPTGCGLCGVESLGDALRPAPLARGAASCSAGDLLEAMEAMSRGQ